jgi:integrase
VPKTPRGKRIVDASTGTYQVVNKAPNGEAVPYFDKSRGVWVAPWRKADGKVGRPTGKTRVLAVASRDRHLAKAADEERFAALDEGFEADSTVADVTAWWLQNVARHRVRATTFATYRKQARLIEAGLGDTPARQLRHAQVAAFISDLLDEGSASRARSVRTLLVQIMDQAVGLGLAAENFARQVRAPKLPKVQRRTVTPAETQQLLAEVDDRFTAAVGLCYVQGWRISEALGLAWGDIDLDSGTVRLRRGSTYTDGVGMVLGPTKTQRTAGMQSLSPTVIRLLSIRRQIQDDDRAKVGGWPDVEYDREHLDLVFTTAAGTPMLRQHVDRAIRAAATRAGIDPTGLGTHAGRRSVVTNLFASGAMDLGDVALFVGHSDTSTTRGYVQHEGDRPRQISERAFELLDPDWTAQPDDA